MTNTTHRWNRKLDGAYTCTQKLPSLCSTSTCTQSTFTLTLWKPAHEQMYKNTVTNIIGLDRLLSKYRLCSYRFMIKKRHRLYTRAGHTQEQRSYNRFTFRNSSAVQKLSAQRLQPASRATAEPQVRTEKQTFWWFWSKVCFMYRMLLLSDASKEILACLQVCLWDEMKWTWNKQTSSLWMRRRRLKMHFYLQRHNLVDRFLFQLLHTSE